MTQTNKPQRSKRSDPKPLLGTLKMTTAIGAVSLTLAGWGLLSRVEATNAAQAALSSPAEIVSSASAAVSFPASSNSSLASRVDSARAKATTAATLPTPTPVVESAGNGSAGATTTGVTLDVVQWVQTNADDRVAVVRDSGGVLWYVWGTDVPRIEQGLSPQYQPLPVNRQGRSRHS